jgi:hypothetical protein
MIQQTRNTDLVFMIDCTGSMASYIHTTKLQIEGIVAALVAEYQNEVSYRSPVCIKIQNAGF